MTTDLRERLDELMESWDLDSGSASHPSDRQKLREFFVDWYLQTGESLAHGDWETYLRESRGWKGPQVSEVVDLPSDCVAVIRYLGVRS